MSRKTVSFEQLMEEAKTAAKAPNGHKPKSTPKQTTPQPVATSKPDDLREENNELRGKLQAILQQNRTLQQSLDELNAQFGITFPDEETFTKFTNFVRNFLIAGNGEPVDLDVLGRQIEELQHRSCVTEMLPASPPIAFTQGPPPATSSDANDKKLKLRKRLKQKAKEFVNPQIQPGNS